MTLCIRPHTGPGLSVMGLFPMLTYDQPVMAPLLTLDHGGPRGHHPSGGGAGGCLPAPG